MPIFLFLSILIFTVTQSASTKLYQKCGGDPLPFNAIKSSFAFLPFLVSMVFGFTFHLPTVFYGVIYGGLMSVSMICGYQALKCGRMALTSMLVSFSVAIPLLYGICIGEEVTIFKIVGFCLLALTIVFMNLGKKSADKQSESNKNNGKWWLFVGLTFFANGISSVLQKVHQSEYPKLYVTELMAVATCVCCVIFIALTISKQGVQGWKEVRGKWYGVLAGVCTAIANFCTTTLAGFESATLLFPMITAGTIVLTIVCGRTVFKENFKANHYFAIVCGICSVIFLKL